jgi:hypothetical protein
MSGESAEGCTKVAQRHDFIPRKHRDVVDLFFNQPTFLHVGLTACLLSNRAQGENYACSIAR